MEENGTIRLRPPLPAEIGIGHKRKQKRKLKKNQQNFRPSKETIDDVKFVTTSEEVSFSPKQSKRIKDNRRVKLPKEPEADHEITPRSRKITKTQKTIFEENIETFIQKELENTFSNADRIYVYQRAFDFLLNEFQQRRNLLSKIKQQYDLTAKSLLLRKREMETRKLTEYDAEENYNEVLTKMRKAKKIEFKQLKEKADELMNHLIELRLDKSSLTKDLEKLEIKNKELQAITKIQQDKTGDVAIKFQLLQDDIGNITRDISDQGKELFKLNTKLNETTGSTNDLRIKYQQRLEELDSKQKEREEIEKRSYEDERTLAMLEEELEEINRDIVRLDRDKAQEIERAKRIKDRSVQSDSKMKQLLKEAGFDFDNLSVTEIIQMLVNQKMKK